MDLRLQRFSSMPNDTLGLLFIDDDFACFTLEDEHRDVKVGGETRIPWGKYTIELRQVGGFDARYKAKFPDMHKGMLWLRDVSGFEYILIHIGNTDDDTAGCILVGDTCTQNVSGAGFVGSSKKAYKRIYPPIAAAIERGEVVTIDIMEVVQ